MVNGPHDEYLDLCAGRALGSLDGPDEDRLRRHLVAGCPDCEPALRDFEEAATVLAASAPAALPSPERKRRVLAEVESLAPVTDLERARGRRSPATRWLAAAAVLLTFTTIAFWQRSERFRGERDALVTELAQVQAELEETQWLPKLVFAGDTDCFDLEGTGEGGAALRATACVDRASGDALVVFNDFAPPSDRDYELWALRGDQVESLGVIRPTADGHAVVQRRALADPDLVTALAVSLEPAGGSPGPGPSGPVVMVGAIGG